MPGPTNKLSSDYPVYKLFDYIMPYLSEVSPNLISFASFAMMYPILNNLYYNGSTVALIMFVIIKQTLDCLDGAVARAHNKTSKMGELIDILCDTMSAILYLQFAHYKIKYMKTSNILLYTLYILIVLGICSEMYQLYNMFICMLDKEKKSQSCKVNIYANKYNNFVSDNSIIVQIFTVLAFKTNGFSC